MRLRNTIWKTIFGRMSVGVGVGGAQIRSCHLYFDTVEQ